MNCPEYDSEIIDMAAGELDSASEVSLRAHISFCPACRQALQDITALFDTARKECVQSAPERRNAFPASRARSRHVSVWTAAAAALIAALAGGWFGAHFGAGRAEPLRRDVIVARLTQRQEGFWSTRPYARYSRPAVSARPDSIWAYPVPLDSKASSKMHDEGDSI